MKNKLIRIALSVGLAAAFTPAVPTIAFASDTTTGIVEAISTEQQLKEAALEGGTYKLSNSIEIGNYVDQDKGIKAYVQVAKDLTIDLSGKDITRIKGNLDKGTTVFNILADATLTINNSGEKSTISNEVPAGKSYSNNSAISVKGILNLNGNIEINSGCTGVFVYKSFTSNGAIINARGTCVAGSGDGNATISLTDTILNNTGQAYKKPGAEGEGYFDWAPVSVNGLGKNNKIALNGCTITSKNTSVYFPAVDSEYKIENCTITSESGSGVEVRGGNLTIDGSETKIVSEASKLQAAPNGSGGTTNGAALAVVEHTTNDEMTVTIKDGNFSGPAAVFSANVQNVTARPVIHIEGGSYTSSITPAEKMATYAAEAVEFITYENKAICINNGDVETAEVSGGTFSDTSFVEFLAAGKVGLCETENKYIVAADEATAQSRAAALVTTQGSKKVYYIDKAVAEADVDAKRIEGEITYLDPKITASDPDVKGDTSSTIIAGEYTPDQNTGAATVENNTATISIKSGNNAVTKSEATISSETAQSFDRADSTPALTLEMDTATVTLDQVAVKTMAGAASTGGGNVTVSVEKTAESAPNDPAAQYDIKVAVEDSTESILKGTGEGTLTVAVPVPDAIKDAVQAFVYRVIEGSQQLTSRGITVIGIKDGKVAFTTNHLSTFAIYATQQEMADNAGGVGGGGGAVSAAKQVTERIAGVEAPQTAIEISKKAFPDGSSNVVIARCDDFADAMSSTGLAGALECPILTTDPDALSSGVADEVKRLGAKNAYIIGGKGAIPADVEGELDKIGVTSSRIYGAEAWDTSVACAAAISENKGNSRGEAIIATSKNFQDALSISSYAYKNAVPIYLTDSADGLVSDASSAINSLNGKVYVAGGNAVVPKAIAEDVFGARVVRMAGKDGYDTSNQIATYMASEGLLGDEAVCLATGALAAKGSDALSGAALAAQNDAPMLLVSGNASIEDVNTITIKGNDSQGSAAFIAANGKTINHAYVLGGAAVMPDSILTQVNDTVNGK